MSTDTTTHLQLPYLAASQAQKHVTVNESLRRLDAIVQLGVVSATIAAEPSAPEDGDVYILPSGKTGTHWGAMTNLALAYYRDGAWEEITPREGFAAWAKDTDKWLIYSGAAWLEADNALSRAIAGLTSNGLVTRTSGTAAAARTLTAGAGISITNGDGVSGNPTVAVNTAASLPWSGTPNFTAGAIFNNWFYVQMADARAYLDDTSGGGRSFILRSFGGDLQFYDNTAGALRARFDANGHFLPGADNTYNLGSASQRIKEVFAATGAINTSDAREKTPLQPLPDSVKRAVRRVLGSVGVFQWIESVAAKGEDGARLHVGVTAQAVRDAFAAEGEDAERWALFCADRVESEDIEPKERLGLRIDQLLLLAIGALG